MGTLGEVEALARRCDRDRSPEIRQDREEAEAEGATVERDAAGAALIEHATELATACEDVLADRPDLLAALGLR